MGNAEYMGSFKPSAISTPTANQSQSCDNNTNSSQSQQDYEASVDNQAMSEPSDNVMTVKQEPEPEEECYLIDSDSNAGSDITSYSHADNSQSQSWSVNEQSGFNLSELDMVSAANFHQQFGNLAGMAGGSGIGGEMSGIPGNQS